jgi:hypothetical protein
LLLRQPGRWSRRPYGLPVCAVGPVRVFPVVTSFRFGCGVSCRVGSPPSPSPSGCACALLLPPRSTAGTSRMSAVRVGSPVRTVPRVKFFIRPRMVRDLRKVRE